MTDEEIDTIMDTLDDGYTLIVAFRRSLAEDLNAIEQRGVSGPFDMALVKQFVAEMQEDMDELGQPVGAFEVQRIDFYPGEGVHNQTPIRLAVYRRDGKVELSRTSHDEVY